MKARIDEAHRAFIRGLPCSACGTRVNVQCAHVRAHHWDSIVVPVEERGGCGIKPHDKWTLPSCHHCHAKQHNKGERTFWGLHNINPLRLAQALWCNAPNRNACLNIILRHRNGAEDL